MDYRDRLSLYGLNLPPHEFDQNKMIITFEYDDGENEPIEYTLQCDFVVCEYCRGQGKYVNPSIDSHGISPEEFDEDPSFREDYFSGRFDVKCQACKGQRVLPEPKTSDSKAFKVWRELCEDRAAYARECEFERRMGC